MENLGDGQFRNRVLAEDIARVSDVRGVDLNADGEMDLAVGQSAMHRVHVEKSLVFH